MKTTYNYKEFREKITYLPDKIIELIMSEDVETSFMVAKQYNFDINKLPKEIIAKISAVSGWCYAYSYEVHFNFLRIPPEIIHCIAKDWWCSYRYAKAVDFNKMLVPEEIWESYYLNRYNLYFKSQFTIDKITSTIPLSPEKKSKGIITYIKHVIHNILSNYLP